MLVPQKKENEKQRLEELESYSILDTLPEKEYDEITFLASQICGTPISLISLIDENRQWFKSNLGLEVRETAREIAFCAHAINEQENIFIVNDSRIDDRFRDNPLVTNNPFVIFYAGIPLVSPNGHALGTLCVIDNEPRTLDDSQINALKILSNQLMRLLELRLSIIDLKKSEENLKRLNATKDKLFSIIGHDLREPIGGLKPLIDYLLKSADLTDTEKVKKVLTLIQKSSTTAFNLMENVLGWARSQLNEIIYTPEEVNLAVLVAKTIEPFADSLYNKKLNIFVNIPNNTKIWADRNMLMAVFRNLISNAIKFTPEGNSIEIISIVENGNHIIKVIDQGIGIESDRILKLFDKTEYTSTYGTSGEKGNGIGLLLCKDFIERNGGTLFVESKPNQGSVFGFTIPIKLD
ncbi:GAF domain-containing sensor histidine kinase [Flavobacterium sp. SUN046]|uniref:GAF domain-containing sensor histidine kinase n=1 Tax=Flavobacterium sp. SUN046 TaxID=3002440 RepID=UPI002DBD43F8|nr:GAF domain-containing sensor histidine kinase [Flavobacterium sp. SUN046]